MEPRPKLFFSEYGHVAYQIKAEGAGSHMVANILPTDTPSTQGVGSKGQTIYLSESSHVAYQIKADDAGSNMVANILPTDKLLTQGVGSKGQTISLLKVDMLRIKLKGIEHRAPRKQVCCHYTHQRPLGWDQKVIFFVLF